jgi:hypothetical protein
MVDGFIVAGTFQFLMLLRGPSGNFYGVDALRFLKYCGFGTLFCRYVLYFFN